MERKETATRTVGGSLESLDDAELVLRIRQGDDRAFRVFYHRYARYVAGVVYRLMGSDQEIEDLVQDTFLAALSSLEGLEDPARARPWLATIAVRQVYRLLSKRRRRRDLRLELARSMRTDVSPRDREFVLSLYRCLEDLAPKFRIPWILHRIEGETLPETARMCGVSVATVKRRIARADEHVRRRLGDGR